MRLNNKRRLATKSGPKRAARGFAGLAAALCCLGDARRLTLLKLLLKQEQLCVSEVADRLAISVALASHHLRALAEVGLVEPVRTGVRVCYRFERGSGIARDIKRLLVSYGG